MNLTEELGDVKKQAEIQVMKNLNSKKKKLKGLMLRKRHTQIQIEKKEEIEYMENL